MLTTKEAAQRLGLKTTGAVRQLILAGRLKAEKRGRDWMIEETEVERFKEEPRKVGRPKSGKTGSIDSQIDSYGAKKNDAETSF